MRSLLFFILNTTGFCADRIKVACIGESITFGHGVENRDLNSYPLQFQKLLGSDYEIHNSGFGEVLLKKMESCLIETAKSLKL